MVYFDINVIWKVVKIVRNKFVAGMLSLIFVLLLLPSAQASGFSQDADAIEETAKSVLMLSVYNSRNQLIATGSGFCAINNRILITNYHVIENASRVIATSDDETNYTLDQVLCADKNMDIAIIGFNKSTNLTPLYLRPDNQLKRGSAVVAIGSPKGLKNTVSIGNISSQYEENGVPWIQFTAPISHGSSGGVLLNDDGQVIGVTSATYKDGQNLNLAINIGVAQAMYNAWNGKSYPLSNFLSSAKMDFSNVYCIDTTEENMRTEEPISSWICTNCGTQNTTKFCSECGAEKPIWICACGKINNGKFCGACGRSVAEMIKEINNGFVALDQGQYEAAISIFKQLDQFNCVSFKTVRGKNISAYDSYKESYYLWAEESKASEADPDTIVSLYQEAAGYLDAENKIKTTYYDAGISLLNSEAFDSAIVYFQKAGDYEDAKNKIDEANYLAGKKLFDSGTFKSAITKFQASNHYSDADQLILASHYSIGLHYLEKKKYPQAVSSFSKAENYSDAKTQIKKTYYLHGLDDMNIGAYGTAKAYFSKADDYLDAAEKIKEISQLELSKKYEAAEAAFAKGDYVSAAAKFNEIKDYSDAKTRVLQCYYERAKQLLVEKKYDEAGEYFSMAGSYSDASYMETEAIYLRIFDYVKKTNLNNIITKISRYNNALDSLSKIKSKNSNAAALYQQLSYEMGVYYLQQNYFDNAKKHFSNAGDFKDAKEKLFEAKTKHVNHLISKECYQEAYDLVLDEKKSKQSLGNFTVLTIGDKSNAMKTILAIAKGMEYIETYPKDENEYKEKYEKTVKKVEKALELADDGIISLDEMVVFSQLIYPSFENEKVGKLLEKLSDLEFLSSLPETHTEYERSKYLSGIKKAEKALGLRVDGLITPSEYDIILAQKVATPANPQNMKTTVNNANVTITWNDNQKNVWYNVYRGSTLIATTKEKRFVDKNVKTGTSYTYYVQVCKYTTRSSKVSKFCTVEKYYKVIDIAELSKKVSVYRDDYVSLTNLKREAQYFKGNDLYMLCKKASNGKTYYIYLVFKNYYNWDWDDGKGIKDKKITSMDAKGIVTTIYDTKYHKGTIPVITLDRITWSY